MQIDFKETLLEGRWQIENGRVVENPECRRIHDLISSYLILLGSSENGWEKLFRDPADGRYWELTYPHSYLHGGGPPLLQNISTADAKAKYNFKDK